MTAINITHVGVVVGSYTCSIAPRGRKLATGIDYCSPWFIEISEIGAIMHQILCERLSLSLFSRFCVLIS
ncbi:uncharacterized protein SPAR_M00120 [Saccharomyces paradoxus]|uniref:Uncharacterized protein n=1 Tax=Saccharomyces paradoxus TaxID=27291 RepID=A0A8B8UWQ7_SACPA|nr:uncharacterized protein SPAR_M00120 [Saccharomyces paradoxus]QHS75167.1 hypothetical protein SPAR_M00120 [Saccharomyces paradoxus]